MKARLPCDAPARTLTRVAWPGGPCEVKRPASAKNGATEPLFMAIRDSLPSVRSVSPLYRTPVAVSMERKQLLLGA